MLKTSNEKLLALYALLLLTIVDHCTGQDFYPGSASHRSDVGAPYSQGYGNTQWQSSQDRRTQEYGNYDNQNSFTNNDRGTRDNMLNANSRVDYRQNRNNQMNSQYSGDSYRQQQQQFQQQQPQMSYAQGEPNVYGNVRPFPNRAPTYRDERNMLENNYQPPIQNSVFQVPQIPRQAYQPSGSQNNLYNNDIRGDMNRMYQVDQNPQPRRYPRTNKIMQASNEGRSLMSESRDMPYVSQGTRDNNAILAAPRSRFNGERNEFQYRPTNFQADAINDPIKVTDPSRRSYDSLAVPIERYGAAYKNPYDTRYRNSYERTYNIPEATSLPRGLEFAGRSYESKRRNSLDSLGNTDQQWNQQSQLVPGMTANALGSILGISTTSITDIARKPSVFLRSMQSAQKSHYPLTGVAFNDPEVNVVTRSNTPEDKAGLLSDISHTLDQLAMADKLSMYNGWDPKYVQSRSKYKYDMPVQMIIISDSNTFSELRADATSSGSFIGALPPSAIDENLFSVRKGQMKLPTVVVRNSPDQSTDKNNEEADIKTTVMTKDKPPAKNTVSVVTKYITKSPEKDFAGSARGATLSQSTDNNGNIRVPDIDNDSNSGSNMNYNDGFINLINDRRW